MGKAVQWAAVESGQVLQPVWLLSELATKWEDPLSRQMHGWYELRHHSCKTTKAGLRMVLLHFSKYAPRRIGFIPQWLLFEQKEMTRLREILTNGRNFPPTHEIVRWIHTTRDAVSSFVVMVLVVTLFPSKRWLFYWTSMTVLQNVFRLHHWP